MSLAKRLADKVTVPTKDFYSGEIEEKIPVAKLSIGGLEKVNERVDINLWSHILDTFSANLEDVTDEDDLKDVDVNQKEMVKFMSALDYKLQLELMWESFKTAMDEKVTKEQANKIYSYGMSDEQQMEALMYALQGVQEEAVQEKAEEKADGSGNPTTTDSEEEQSASTE